MGCDCAMMARAGQRFLTSHHPGCSRYDPEGDARQIILELIAGIESQAQDCDGIHEDLWPAYQRARIAVGLPPMPETDR